MKASRYLAVLTLAAGLFETQLIASGSQAPQDPVSGNWAEIDTNNERVVEAANFAAKQLGYTHVVKILKAEVQVVAGWNYRLTLWVPSGGLMLTADVVVWRKPDDTKLLTSYELSI